MLVLAGKEPSRAEARTYTDRDVARAGLFRSFRHSAIFIAVRLALVSAGRFQLTKTKKRPLPNALTDQHYDSDFQSETGV